MGIFYDWNAKGLEFAIPKGDIAMTESENVRQRQYLREQRMLPVAIELDPSGKIFMEAHIKFACNLSPRLYFFDDWPRGQNRKNTYRRYRPSQQMGKHNNLKLVATMSSVLLDCWF